MKGKDEIEQLFQKELGNYQAKVRPDLWNGIQAGITTGATGVATTMSLAAKVAIGLGTVAAITIGTVLFTNNNTPSVEKPLPQEVVSDSERINNTVEKTPLSTHENIELKNDNPSEVVRNITENQAIERISSADVAERNEGQTSSSTSNTSEPINTSPQEVVSQLMPIVMQPQVEKTAKPIVTIEQEAKVDLSKIEIQVNKTNNQSVSFSALNIPSGAEVIWNFGDGTFEESFAPQHFYYVSGEYKVTLDVRLEDQHIAKSTMVDVRVQGEIGELPNIFTPNGDGRNDEFFIETKYLKNFKLTVMDNHQNVVYETSNPDFRWNGIDRFGNPVKDGRYVYVIVAEDEAGNAINKYQELIISR